MNESNDVGTIRFAATQAPFYSYFLNMDPVEVEGYWSDIIIAVLKQFNWDYEGQLESNSLIDHGKIYGEGNGTGIFGLLIRNETDIMLKPVDLNPDDFRYLDYTPITWEVDLKILSSEASTAKFHSSDFAFMDIYSPWVWLAWGMSLFLFAVFLIFAKILLSTYPENQHRDSSSNGLIGIFLDAYRIPLNQGVELPPSKHTHLRIAALCWIVGCFLLNVGFTSGLLTKLTLPPKPIYIEKMEDILKYPHLLIQIYKNTEIAKIFQRSDNDVARQIQDRIVRFNTAIDLADIDPEGTSKRVIRGEMIYFQFEDGLKAIMPSLFECEIYKGIHISEESAYRAQFALPMRKDLDPKKAKIFKRTIQALFEGMITTHALTFDYWKYRECFMVDPVPLKPLDISAIKVISYGLLLGYLCSIIVLIIEIKYPPKMESQRNRMKMFRNSIHT